jgi:hypothetical protein
LVTALFCSPRFEVRHTLQYPRRWKLQFKSKSWIFLPMALAITFLFITFECLSIVVVNTD